VRPTAETPVVGTTAQNLQAAFDGETYEYEVMYPGFLATAQAEGMTDAVRIFGYAMRAEEVHAGNFKDVKSNLANAAYLNRTYGAVYRCLTCGEVVTTRPTNCPICGRPGSTFMAYDDPIFGYAEVSATVLKLKGNQNELTIIVTEVFSDGSVNPIVAKILISNNASGTYKVGAYKVFVDTKGNTDVRQIYIVK
jgi:hypothetical protein